VSHARPAAGRHAIRFARIAFALSLALGACARARRPIRDAFAGWSFAALALSLALGACARARRAIRGAFAGWSFAALALSLALGACAPVIKPAGPPVMAPRLEADRLVMPDGAELPLRRWVPVEKPRAVILALHGFNDYSQAFIEPGLDWAKDGIATFAYDQRGFGDAPNPGYWPGDETLEADLRTATGLLRAKYPDTPFYLLGESMGGAVLMAAAASPDPPPADGLILAAPAIWGRELQGPIPTGLLWFFAHTMPWLTLSGAELNIQPSDNIEMLRALGRDPRVIKETRVDAIYGLVGLMDKSLAAAPRIKSPALVLYGSREEVIPGKAALTMLRRLPPPPERPRVALYPRGYHMLLRDLEAGVVREDIAAWIADPRAALPSHADARAEAALADGAEDLKAATN
jgi:alpha-beta hydrolase superfamily lysophospholipase